MNRPSIRSLHGLRRRLRDLLWLQSSCFHLRRSAGAAPAASPNGAQAESTPRCGTAA